MDIKNEFITYSKSMSILSFFDIFEKKMFWNTNETLRIFYLKKKDSMLNSRFFF